MNDKYLEWCRAMDKEMGPPFSNKATTPGWQAIFEQRERLIVKLEQELGKKTERIAELEYEIRISDMYGYHTLEMLNLARERLRKTTRVLR